MCATPFELAKNCGISRAVMTGLLDGLEDKGYVERENHPSDHRALSITLTPKGHQFLDWIAPQDPYQLSDLTDILREPEQEKLYELAIKITHLFA